MKKQVAELKIQKPDRAKLSERESLRRMQEFSKRKEKFIATVRKSKD